MRRFSGFAGALTLAALVLVGLPDTAKAQSLFFSPATAGLSISGPGGAAGPVQVGVSSGSQINSLFVSSINTSDHTNWLCANVGSSNTINVYVGSSTCNSSATTSQLASNQSYTGTISVTGNGGALSGTLNVSLGVGSTGALGNGFSR